MIKYEDKIKKELTSEKSFIDIVMNINQIMINNDERNKKILDVLTDKKVNQELRLHNAIQLIK